MIVYYSCQRTWLCLNIILTSFILFILWASPASFHSQTLTHAGYLREQLYEVQKGVCQMCRLDAQGFVNRLKCTKDITARADLLNKSTFRSLSKNQKKTMISQLSAGLVGVCMDFVLTLHMPVLFFLITPLFLIWNTMVETKTGMFDLIRISSFTNKTYSWGEGDSKFRLFLCNSHLFSFPTVTVVTYDILSPLSHCHTLGANGESRCWYAHFVYLGSFVFEKACQCKVNNS